MTTTETLATDVAIAPDAESTEPRTYWYLTTYGECPVCGRSGKIRERIYDRPKPCEYGDRHVFEEDYCGCMEGQR